MTTKLVLSLKLMRLHQWIKNLLIFAPLFFSKQIHSLHLLLPAAIAFASFSLAASFIYILNDIRDVESDRKHPKKRKRPLASGKLTMTFARGMMLTLLALVAVLALLVKIEVFGFVVLYLSLNVAYCFYLKQKAILDIIVIASGFVIRLLVGSFATGVHLSMWIVIMTFLLALFIALAKRRDDVLIFERTGKTLRPSLQGYNLKFIDSSMMIMAAVVIVSYIQYTTSASVITRVKSDSLYYTVFFVIVGIMRYLQITLVREKSGSPTEIVLSDRGMILVILSWLTSFYFFLY